MYRRATALQSFARAVAAEGGWAQQQHCWAPQHALLVPSRWHSQLVGQQQGEEEQQKRADYLYQAPFGAIVRRVKKLSLFSCACAVCAGPIILGMDAQTTLQAKLSITATLSAFGVFTTGLLHCFTSPYVQRLHYHAATDSVEVNTLSVLGRPKTARFHMAEARAADSVHPLTSFEAHGRHYYVEAEYFADKALLARLAPQAAAAHAMGSAEEQLQQSEAARQQQQAAAAQPHHQP